MQRLTVADVRIDERKTRRTIIDADAVRENAMLFYWRLKTYEDTGLTPEEIERLEDENAELKRYRQIAEAQDKKIDETEAENADLRAQKGQPNKRLKPRILRKMMLFQWVWIEVLKPFNDRDKVSAYYSKHYDFTDNTAFCCGYPGITFRFDYADYGKTWLAYRHKPEQEANRND